MHGAEEWAEGWRERVGAAERIVLDAAISTGRACAITPFLVGGPVRDLALGISFTDIDLMIEGEGSEFAAGLAEALGGELRRFSSFLTWRIEFPRNPAVDITTARTESYPEPGALPQVSAASVEQDLFRRDFAANAVALNLFTGKTIDPAGGIADIRSRRLRILHRRSFLDDPTRMYRGVRIGARLGFEFDSDTSSALREAVAINAADLISRERVWREILLAMGEPSPAASLIAMSRAKLFERFLSAPELDANVMMRIETSLRKSTASLDRNLMWAAALVASSSAPAAALDGSGFSLSRTRKAVSLMHEATQLAAGLKETSDPLEKLRLCARSGVEAGILASALSDVAAAIIEEFGDYAELEIGIRGDELGLPYGPHIARALESAREAVYLKRIPKEEALDFARKAGLQYLKGELE